MYRYSFQTYEDANRLDSIIFQSRFQATFHTYIFHYDSRNCGIYERNEKKMKNKKQLQ